VPWTDLLGEYVPWPVTALGVLVLIVWLPPHFYHRYTHPPKETAMPNTLRVPLPASVDARNRAFRTFAQGLAVDVVAAVVLAVGPALVGEHFAWTQGVLARAVAGLAAKTAVQTAVSYVARKVVPPPAG
jgi:hypothetical protein